MNALNVAKSLSLLLSMNQGWYHVKHVRIKKAFPQTTKEDAKVTSQTTIETCGDGLNLGQYECDDGNLINGDGCSSLCTIEPGYTCKTIGSIDICTDIRSPIGILSIKKGNVLVLRFDEMVKVNVDSEVLVKSMKVYLKGITCNFEWNLKESFELGYTFTELEILTVPECSLKGKIETYVIEFDSTNLITDLAYNSMSSKIYQVSSLSYVYISEGMKKAAEAVGDAANSMSLIAFLVMLLFSLLKTAVMGNLWIFINMIQFLSYLPVIDCYIPYCLEQFLTEHMTIKEVTIPFEMLPDSFWTPLDSLAAFVTEPFNNRFLVNGYESISFLYNFAEELTTWLLLVLLYLLLEILTRIVPSSKCSHIHEWKKDYEYNAIIRILIECYLNMNFCAILNLWNVCLNIYSSWALILLQMCFLVLLLELRWYHTVLS